VLIVGFGVVVLGLTVASLPLLVPILRRTPEPGSPLADAPL